jgi:hypothetical protein
MGRSARPGSGRIEELGSRRKGNRLMHKVVEIGLPNQPLVKMRDALVFMRLSGLPEMLFAAIWLFEVFR